MKDKVSYTHQYVAIVDYISKKKKKNRSLLTRDWNIILVHTLRKKNSCANWLIRTTLDKEIVIFCFCPPLFASIWELILWKYLSLDFSFLLSFLFFFLIDKKYIGLKKKIYIGLKKFESNILDLPFAIELTLHV